VDVGVEVAVERFRAEHERSRRKAAAAREADVEDGLRPLLGEGQRGGGGRFHRSDPAGQCGGADGALELALGGGDHEQIHSRNLLPI
jgi:hypothetical protein